MKLPQSFFEDKRERAYISREICTAIPDSVSYKNIVLALLEILQDFVKLELEGEEE